MAHMTAVNTRAYPMNPIPISRPVLMARKIIPISFAVPGAERKRTRLKAPITAIPAPMLPLTTWMITDTTAGIIPIVNIRLSECLVR